MKIRRLCKSAESIPEGQCEAMYLSDNPATMVGQGKHLDDSAAAQLLDLAEDEGAFAIPTETVFRAVGLVLAEHGRPDLLTELETFLAGWLVSRT